MLQARIEPADQQEQAILGMERRLERDERNGEDTTIARIVLVRHYAAYARSMVQQAGGSVTEMKTLTDRDNLVPLAWIEGRCHAID
ncbi:MAG TPA: hypothetical protein VD978_37240 [Azospirillum sp.]|nr:hypothetical protein [Azospirillum sp.]